MSKNMFSATDTQRTLRAYEVKMFTNKSIYEWISNTKSDFIDFDIRKIFIDVPKYDLLRKIYLRTKSMFKKGCIEEVRNFLKLGIDKSFSANKIIGVREIEEYLGGSMSMEEVIDIVNIRTRQYAKRQFTWARGHMKSWNMIYSSDSNDLFKKAINKIS
jgi:tRNA dimethylallyltransferase